MGYRDHGSRPIGDGPEDGVLGLEMATVRRIIAAGTLEAALAVGVPSAGADASPEQPLPPALASLVEEGYARSAPLPRLSPECGRIQVSRGRLRDGIRRGRGQRRVLVSFAAFALVSFTVFLLASLAIGLPLAIVISGGLGSVVLPLP